MNINSRITQLQRKHETLTQAVEHAQRSPAVDHLEIANMKKQKLRLKEEISKLSAN